MIASSSVCSSSANASDLDAMKALYKRPATIPFPAQNPYTPEKAALGKMLFFDPRLSKDQNLNCASCHNPSFGWEVPLPKAVGAAGVPLGRQAPTVINHAWGNRFFWDGRAGSLEEQARGPIESKVEMGIPLSDLVKRLSNIPGYRDVFAKAFPKEGLTGDTILKAIATYERTLVSGTSPFDQWLGGKESAITDSAKKGFALFNGKAKCAGCHSGWRFTDDKFHDIGMPDDKDKGRQAITGKEADVFAFKTPGLREVAQRAPFMHDGSLATLEAVVAHYLSGGVPRPSRSSLLTPLNLSAEEMKQLVDFMMTLSSIATPLALPQLPPPQQ